MAEHCFWDDVARGDGVRWSDNSCDNAPSAPSYHCVTSSSSSCCSSGGGWRRRRRINDNGDWHSVEPTAAVDIASRSRPSARTLTRLPLALCNWGNDDFASVCCTTNANYTGPKRVRHWFKTYVIYNRSSYCKKTLKSRNIEHNTAKLDCINISHLSLPIARAFDHCFIHVVCIFLLLIRALIPTCQQSTDFIETRYDVALATCRVLLCRFP